MLLAFVGLLAVLAVVIGFPYDAWRRGEDSWPCWAVLCVCLPPIALVAYPWHRFWRWQEARAAAH